jgi:hypothetical protein
MRTQDYRKSGTHGKGETFSEGRFRSQSRGTLACAGICSPRPPAYEGNHPSSIRKNFHIRSRLSCVEETPLSEKIFNGLDWLGLGWDPASEECSGFMIVVIHVWLLSLDSVETARNVSSGTPILVWLHFGQQYGWVSATAGRHDAGRILRLRLPALRVGKLRSE